MVTEPTERRYRARAGSFDDIEGIGPLMVRCHDEGRYPPINFKKATNTVCDVVAKGVLIVVERNDGLLVGSCGLMVGDWWFSDARYMRDVWFLVDPEHRSLEVFGLMVRAANAAGEAAGLPLMIGMMTMIDVERKLRVFERYMRPIGAVYLGGAR